MAYVDAQTNSSAKFGTMVVVGGLHAAVGVALVAALSFDVIVLPDLPNPKGVIIETDPVPLPTPEIIETPDVPSYTPPVAPDREIDLPTDTRFKVEVFKGEADDATIFKPVPQFTPAPIPVQPSPAPTFTATGAIPSNGPQGWISTDDYPARDLRRGNEGTARYRVSVSSNGRVDSCDIVASTGSTGLDRATCRNIERRARFDPATNSEGRPVAGSYSGVVTWQIPDLSGGAAPAYCSAAT